MEYIQIIISFIIGGGFSTLISLRYLRRSGKIDYADKAIKFQEEQYDKVLAAYNKLSGENETLHKAVQDLDDKINNIILISCTNAPTCKRRKPIQHESF